MNRRSFFSRAAAAIAGLWASRFLPEPAPYVEPLYKVSHSFGAAVIDDRAIAGVCKPIGWRLYSRPVGADGPWAFHGSGPGSLKSIYVGEDDKIVASFGRDPFVTPETIPIQMDDGTREYWHQVMFEPLPELGASPGWTGDSGYLSRPIVPIFYGAISDE